MKWSVDKIWFYLCLSVMNLAVGVMFYVVTIRPPVAAAITVGPPSNSERAKEPRIIPAITGIPVRIVIPSIATDLSVGVGSYNPSDGSWTIDATKAYYADVSVPINDSNGQTLIYGHAQTTVFAALASIPADAGVEVYTDNGYIFHYTYTSLTEVAPTDMGVFTAAGPPTLVLQTCTGPWDAYRALYSFKLDSVGKA